MKDLERRVPHRCAHFGYSRPRNISRLLSVRVCYCHNSVWVQRGLFSDSLRRSYSALPCLLRDNQGTAVSLVEAEYTLLTAYRLYEDTPTGNLLMRCYANFPLAHLLVPGREGVYNTLQGQET
jgi:hypothetical protein